jgi:hypothetical protein
MVNGIVINGNEFPLVDNIYDDDGCDYCAIYELCECGYRICNLVFHVTDKHFELKKNKYAIRTNENEPKRI